MIAELRALTILAVLCWASLAGLTTLFLRMAMRSDAGFGGAGRGRERGKPTRAGITPVAVPPRHVTSPGGRW